MSSTAFALVVAGALVHAFWNVQAKKARGGIAFTWLFGLVSLTVAIPCAAFAVATTPFAFDPMLGATAVASAVVHLAYFHCLQRGYRSGDFSVVYPVARGAAPLLTVAGAVVLLNEAPGLRGWLGTGAITAGIVALGWRSAPARGTSGASSRATGVYWACLTGACISAYTLIDGWAVSALRIDPLLYYPAGLAMRTVLLAPLALRDREELRVTARASPRQIVLVGLLSPLAYLMILFAMRTASVSQVAPLREMSMLVGLFIGAHSLSERLTAPRVAGVLAVVAGVFLVSYR